MGKAGRVIIEVKDEKGNLIDKRIEDIHSYEHNWVAFLCNLFTFEKTYTVIEPNGTKLSDELKYPFKIIAVGKKKVVGVTGTYNNDGTLCGILLGYGDNQFSVTGYNLLNEIDANKLSPQDMPNPVIKDNYPNEGQITIVLTRNFINQSGSDLKFNQIGLVVFLIGFTPSPSQSEDCYAPTLVRRLEVIFDKLSQDVTVPSNATVSVTMELTFN